MSLRSGMVARDAIKRHSKLEDSFEKKLHFYRIGIKHGVSLMREISLMFS
jgi:hypothetical protein